MWFSSLPDEIHRDAQKDDQPAWYGSGNPEQVLDQVRPFQIGVLDVRIDTYVFVGLVRLRLQAEADLEIGGQIAVECEINASELKSVEILSARVAVGDVIEVVTEHASIDP